MGIADSHGSDGIDGKEGSVTDGHQRDADPTWLEYDESGLGSMAFS